MVVLCTWHSAERFHAVKMEWHIYADPVSLRLPASVSRRETGSAGLHVDRLPPGIWGSLVPEAECVEGGVRGGGGAGLYTAPTQSDSSRLS